MLGNIQKSSVVRRLCKGADLRHSLAALVVDQQIGAGVVLCLVGSLQVAELRMAGGQSPTRFDGLLEIVSATGTIGSGGMHIHISVADCQGTVYGGHLLEGCIVGTTVEVVIGDLSSEWQFDREMDPETGCKELQAIATTGKGH